MQSLQILIQKAQKKLLDSLDTRLVSICLILFDFIRGQAFNTQKQPVHEHAADLFVLRLP